MNIQIEQNRMILLYQ